MSSIMEGLHRLWFSSDDYTQFDEKWKRVEARRKFRFSADLQPDGSG
jgi:hypothetical protein